MGNSNGTGSAGTATTGVVLAAGAGTRLGLGPKALLPYRGRPLVEAVATTLLDGGCREVVVVLGAGASEVQAAATLDRFRLVNNPKWQTGMGGSFLVGDQATDAADHLLIALVDQPGLTPETVERLLARHQPGRITAAAYRRRDSSDGGGAAPHRGHPLLIDTSLREAVCATVTGDAGARGFLRSHPDLVDEVDCSDQSTGEDVDTPDQLGLLH
ncbi:nicotine blue oxidoreductase [Arthrobacter liuii]|uniref:4-diphosphocytidyl-2C-methyl-D-erythritol synthase n=1 Tax=Arthrobacter liuii TaxID=1476996 RepID=A0ABQ2B2S8_9MICC|nr:nucleotidyltransferase family protein [Arthrobacter liuii]GGI02618.1 4-diphosphocytidyl-2C-methyl-D-erythritol synthase [Arthrobacter liuii]